MAVDLALVQVLHGDDDLGIRRVVSELTTALGDPAMVELNLTRLDGKSASDEDIATAINAIPFLAERRLVVVDNPLSRLKAEAARKRFIALLDNVPASTTLVLTVDDMIERGKWATLHPTHWLVKWIEQSGGKAHLREFRLPTLGEMPGWILREAQRQGGKFSPEAAAALREYVTNDTQLAAQEVTKLLTYVNFQRPVEREDVDDLGFAGGQADVFQMVDALAIGDAPRAVRLLHRLLEKQEPLSLFGMIIRQFRLLLQTRELMDEGRPNQTAATLNQVPFVADKLLSQARRFKMERLEAIYRNLLEMDEQMKTSRMSGDLALDAFIAEVTANEKGK